jgi:geranylgeranyl diphosphate synthase type I
MQMPNKTATANTQWKNTVQLTGLKILEKFKQAVVSDVSEGELRVILADFGSRWKDTLRPALTSLSCQAVGGKPEDADDAALMFTLLAAGIGIHDDIIDKSPINHFRKTVLGQHGLDKALLVGDLLIVKAWSRVSDLIRQHSNQLQVAAIAQLYGKFTMEICQAEFNETLCRRNLDYDLDFHRKILWGAMAETEACARVGAILGGGSMGEVEALGGFGRRLGYNYRLADELRDCLNLEGNLPHRIENESLPLPIMFAAKSSQENHIKIYKIIQKQSLDPLDVRELLKTCFETEAFAYVSDVAKENKKQAFNELRKLKPTEARKILAAALKQSYFDIKKLAL